MLSARREFMQPHGIKVAQIFARVMRKLRSMPGQLRTPKLFKFFVMRTAVARAASSSIGLFLSGHIDCTGKADREFISSASLLAVLGSASGTSRQ